MKLHEILKDIQLEYSLGTLEFIRISGLSNGVYYDIKRGKKTSLYPKQLNNLKLAFKDYNFSELETSRKSLKEEILAEIDEKLKVFEAKMNQRIQDGKMTNQQRIKLIEDIKEDINRVV